MNYGRSIAYPCFKKGSVAILKLNALFVDMEHLFLWQKKAVLASMTHIKTTKQKQDIRGETRAANSNSNSNSKNSAILAELELEK